jgi:hypothetical protein
MTSSVLAALCVAVGALGLVNLILIFGVIARLRVLQGALSVQPTRDPALPPLGSKIGTFEVTMSDGVHLTDSVVQGDEAIVGFFSAGCGPCVELREKLIDNPPHLPFFAFIDGEPDDLDSLKIADKLRALGPVAIVNETDAVCRAFKPNGFPTLFRTSQGAIAAVGHYLHDVL